MTNLAKNEVETYSKEIRVGDCLVTASFEIKGKPHDQYVNEVSLKISDTGAKPSVTQGSISFDIWYTVTNLDEWRQIYELMREVLIEAEEVGYALANPEEFG